MRVIILANGEIRDYSHISTYILPDDYIICADGGAKHAYHMHLIPQIILGDFDSIDQEWYQHYKNKRVSIQSFPSEKDETDTELALRYAIQLKPDKIILMACSGNRLDHTLANIQLLKQGLDAGIDMVMLDNSNEIYIVKNSLQINGKIGDTISLLPLTESVTGIYAAPLYYPVENLSITIGSPVGISNVMLSSDVTLTVTSGYLLVIKATDD